MHSQDVFVGCVSIVLGRASLAAAASGGRLVRWSHLARGIERVGGKPAVVITYALIGFFLVGVGISLLT
ncbi:MAG: hypothetical protein ACTHOU_03060 [Aureliella sp.]